VYVFEHENGDPATDDIFVGATASQIFSSLHFCVEGAGHAVPPKAACVVIFGVIV
jgi:hypothetical protein